MKSSFRSLCGFFFTKFALVCFGSEAELLFVVLSQEVISMVVTAVLL